MIDLAMRQPGLVQPRGMRDGYNVHACRVGRADAAVGVFKRDAVLRRKASAAAPLGRLPDAACRC